MFDMLEDLYSRVDFDPKYPAIYDFTGSAAIAYRVDVVSFVERIRKLRSGISEKKNWYCGKQYQPKVFGQHVYQACKLGKFTSGNV